MPQISWMRAYQLLQEHMRFVFMHSLPDKTLTHSSFLCLCLCMKLKWRKVILQKSVEENTVRSFLFCLSLLLSPTLFLCHLCPLPLLSIPVCPRGWQSCVGSRRARLSPARRSWGVTARSHLKVWYSSWQTARPNCVALNSNCEWACLCVGNSQKNDWKNMKKEKINVNRNQFFHTLQCCSITSSRSILTVIIDSLLNGIISERALLASYNSFVWMYIWFIFIN